MISGKIGGRIGPPGVEGPEGPIGQLLTGTGSPAGVVTATVGKIYIDTAATNGATAWIKVSGTGNTGWRVLYGDTGWRDLTSLLVNGWTMATPGFTAVRRIGSTVHLRTRALTGSAATSSTFATLPQGFIPAIQTGGMAGSTTGSSHPVQVNGAGGATVGNVAGGAAYTTFVGSALQISYPVEDSNTQAWPAVLPGDPA